MNHDQLKNLLRIQKFVGGKFIIVEDGEPKAVLMDYHEFEDLVTPRVVDELKNRLNRIDDVNREITQVQLEEDGVNEEEEIDQAPEIRIEPLL